MASQVIYIYSTLSASVAYEIAGDQVVIHGSANVADRNIITPRGKVTAITPEQYALLKDNEVFKLHEKNGFITAEKAKEDADKVASNLTGRDNSAPDTPETLVLNDPEVEDVKGTKVTRKQRKD